MMVVKILSQLVLVVYVPGTFMFSYFTQDQDKATYHQASVLNGSMTLRKSSSSNQFFNTYSHSFHGIV